MTLAILTACNIESAITGSQVAESLFSKMTDIMIAQYPQCATPITMEPSTDANKDKYQVENEEVIAEVYYDPIIQQTVQQTAEDHLASTGGNEKISGTQH